MTNMYIVVPALLLLALFVQEGEPIHCYVCSSDLDPRCSDPFDSKTISYGDCDIKTFTYPNMEFTKIVCRKMKKIIDGHMIITRGCAWMKVDDYTSTCPTSNNGPNIVTSFCETCDYDACNSATTIGKTLALIIAPLSILFFK